MTQDDLFYKQSIDGRSSITCIKWQVKFYKIHNVYFKIGIN